MRKKGRLFGVLALTVALAGSGAVAGTILSGEVTTSIPVTVSRALLLQDPRIVGDGDIENINTSVSPDNSEFSTVVMIGPVEEENYDIELPIFNESDSDIWAILDLTWSRELIAEKQIRIVGSGRIENVVKVAENKWKFLVPKESAGRRASPYDGVRIEILNVKKAPNTYQVSGEIFPVEF